MVDNPDQLLTTNNNSKWTGNLLFSWEHYYNFWLINSATGPEGEVVSRFDRLSRVKSPFTRTTP